MANPELDGAGLPGVRQAIEIIDATPVTPRTERRALLAAQGDRLAEDVVTDRAYPPFDKSLMDGYAVRRSDVEGKGVGVELRVVGEVAAGRMPSRAIGPGEAMAIMTGAPLPEGADGVVPIEEVEERGRGGEGETHAADAHGPERSPVSTPFSPTPPLPHSPTIVLPRPVQAGRYVAQRGSDAPVGRTVLAKGTVLGPAQLSVAASVGAAEVLVYARPRVAVLGTGDELVPVDQTPGPAQVRNANNVMLMALLRRLGCEPTDLGVVRDAAAAVRLALAEAMDPSRFDALFVTGGMSMGAYDFVPRTLLDLGVEMKVTKVRIKPGKPFVFGVSTRLGCGGVGAWGGNEPAVPIDVPHPHIPTSPPPHVPTCPPHVYVFGLPGNPVSAFICALRLASRLLARLGGGPVAERWLSGRLDAGLPANGPREFYQPALRTAQPGSKSAQANFAAITPLAWKGSADVFTLAAANVLIVRGENEPPLPIGTVIRVLEI